MKKALVTGATGFIGTWLVQELLSQGVEVIAVVRQERRFEENIFESNRVRVVFCNMENSRDLQNLLSDRDIDVAFHLAWGGVSGEGAKDPIRQIANLTNTIYLIETLAEMGCSTIVGAGSLHEIESFYEMKEDKPISNLGYMYKATKLSAHWMGKAIAGAKGVRFFWPIISNAYGEGEKSSRLINSVIRTMLRGESPKVSQGKQLYDFVHISDVVHALYLIGEKGVDGTNYFIGSGDPRPLREYLKIVETTVNLMNHTNICLGFGQMGADVVYLPKEIFDTKTLIRDTGFKLQVPFTVGIQRTISSIKNEK